MKLEEKHWGQVWESFQERRILEALGGRDQKEKMADRIDNIQNGGGESQQKNEKRGVPKRDKKIKHSKIEMTFKAVALDSGIHWSLLEEEFQLLVEELGYLLWLIGDQVVGLAG